MHHQWSQNRTDEEEDDDDDDDEIIYRTARTNNDVNSTESMSRVDVDSLDVPHYGRKIDLSSLASKPLPPPPPPLSTTTSDIPPPPPPKKYGGKLSPLPKYNVSHRKIRLRSERRGPTNTTHDTGAYAWAVVSSMYWKLMVVLEVVFCLTDVVHDGNVLMCYQRIFLLFMFCTAIATIIGMYIYTMYTKYPVESGQRSMDEMADPEGGSFSSIHGTLRRAYIRRQALCRTNFYLRLGAVVFGIATLIYYGFEISVHTTGGQRCVDYIIYNLPIVLVVLCFLQIHFLFVNSQVLVGSLRGPAQFCFAHMLATNLALWIRMIGDQSSTRWVIYLSNYTLPNKTAIGQIPNIATLGGLWWTTMFPPEFERVAQFTQCLHNTTLGQMWFQATPFLVPFHLQFCVVSAAVFYVLWSGMSRPYHSQMVTPPPCRSSTSTSIQCQMENKGIFVGLLLLVGGVVVLVMYLILRAQPQFVHDSLWVVSGTLCLVLAVTILAILLGFLKLQGVAYARDAPLPSMLDSVLTSATSAGPLLYSVLGLVVATSHLDTNADVLVMSHSGLLLIEVFLQNIYIAERWRRVPSRSGQQIIQVMLFANATLWLLDTFMTASSDSQKLQEHFYGPLLWGMLSYSSTPLIALYRFHSSIQLYELWKRAHT